MIPLKLSLRGLYSYRQEQVVDFTRLQDAKLFGIFGPVGSGKSTILEAMTFALYGESERLNRQDNRYYNMMNLKSVEMHIQFEFLAGAELATRYLIDLTVKRRKKEFDKLGSPLRRQMRWENGDWLPDETPTETVVGLSYENFRRTIIIPQGKFQEFMQLTGTDRTRMMKELFQLERFDLQQRTQRLQGANTEALQHVNGRLHQLADATPEALKQQQQKLQEIRNSLLEAEKVLKVLEKEEQEWQRLAEGTERLRDLESSLDALKGDEPVFRRRRERLQEYREALLVFPGLLERREEAGRSAGQSIRELQRLEQELAQCERDLEKSAAAFSAMQSEYLQRDQLMLQATALERRAELQELEQESADLEAALRPANLDLRQAAEMLAECEQQLEKITTDIRKARESLPDSRALAELRNWFAAYRNLQQRQSETEASLAARRRLLPEAEKSKRDLVQSPLLAEWISPLEQTLPARDLLNKLHQANRELKKIIRKLDQQLLQAERDSVLGKMAADLQEGKPCPLCGSTEHPQQYHQADDGTAKRLLRERRVLEQKQEELERIQPALTALAAEVEIHLQAVSQEEQQGQQLHRALQAHLEQFRWQGFAPDKEDVLAAAEDQLAGRSEGIAQLEEELQTLRQTQQELRRQFEDKREAAGKLEKEQTRLQARQETLAGQAAGDPDRPGRPVNTGTLREQAAQLRRRLQEVQQHFPEMERERNTRRGALNELLGQIKAVQSQQSQWLKTGEKLQKELDTALEKSAFQNLDQVTQLLDNALDIAAEEQEIAAFYRKLDNFTDRLQQQREALGTAVFDEAACGVFRARIAEQRALVADLQQQAGLAQGESERRKTELQTQKELQQQAAQLEKRGDNLLVLLKLFRGSGFVNYVSSVFLENLVRVANERFRMLTRQQLQLEVDRENAFLVRDFLNDGQLRSVKTLSGGQTFQAALCLALALADNIQQLSTASQNFFFLDEGFGTLDKQSLQTILDTLKSMRQENRIVGVISHVEELQQEIDVYLKISNDDEKGSAITASWQ